MSELKQYLNFDKAYQHFNSTLFNGNLPPVVVTLTRGRYKGYFAADRFTATDDNDQTISELAMNPDYLGRTEQEALSTLVHEMCHVWQNHFGKKKRRSAYHDREFADKMEEVGLICSRTGEPGGKRTGQSMTHYIFDGGPFAVQCEKALAKYGKLIDWKSDKRTRQTSKPKETFTCPACEQNAWGKPSANLICGVCYENTGEIITMAVRKKGTAE